MEINGKLEFTDLNIFATNYIIYMNQKYSKYFLEEIIKSVNSMRQLVLKLELKPSGKIYCRLRNLIKQYEIDISHFSIKKYILNPKYSKIELEKLAMKSSSIKEMLLNLNLKPNGGNHWNILKKLRQYKIDISHFTKEKHTKEKLQSIVSKCISMSEVLRELGLRPGGGTQAFISKKIKSHNINTSHFLGQKTNSGYRYKGRKGRTWQEILVRKKDGNKENPKTLRRALLESGRQYRCEGENCVITDIWLGKNIKLQIHHIDGDWLNNESNNLIFNCPNCHSQTNNYCSKNRKSNINAK